MFRKLCDRSKISIITWNADKRISLWSSDSCFIKASYKGRITVSSALKRERLRNSITRMQNFLSATGQNVSNVIEILLASPFNEFHVFGIHLIFSGHGYCFNCFCYICMLHFAFPMKFCFFSLPIISMKGFHHSISNSVVHSILCNIIYLLLTSVTTVLFQRLLR